MWYGLNRIELFCSAALALCGASAATSTLDVTRPHAGDLVTVGSTTEVVWTTHTTSGDDLDLVGLCSNASLALYRNGDLYSAITSSPETSPYVQRVQFTLFPIPIPDPTPSPQS